MNNQEVRAKSLEIAVLILGSFPDPSLDKYLSFTDEIASYIYGPKDSKGGSVGFAKVEGV
jgi:hypothetical protein